MRLFGQFDHPLTLRGLRQAQILGEAIRSCQRQLTGVSPVVRQLLAATAIWSSPLTRAMQTAMVGLQPIIAARCCRSATPIALRVNARERQKLGSVDCVGVATDEGYALRGEMTSPSARAPCLPSPRPFPPLPTPTPSLGVASGR